MAPDADIEKIADDLFGLFGVAREDPAADSKLWMAMAVHIFPELAVAPASRGRPKGTRRGQSLWACAVLAKRYDAFAADMRRRYPGTLDHAVMTAFVRKNSDVLKPFRKGFDTQKDLSLHTLNKKITLGRKYYDNIDINNLQIEKQVLTSALDYAPFGAQLLFRGELAELDLTTDAGKDRLLQIAKAINDVVPMSISFGLVTAYPYWKRRPAK